MKEIGNDDNLLPAAKTAQKVFLHRAPLFMSLPSGAPLTPSRFSSKKTLAPHKTLRLGARAFSRAPRVCQYRQDQASHRITSEEEEVPDQWPTSCRLQG